MNAVKINKTTFPENWKELVRTGPAIFNLYLQYLYDGQLRYGPRTIVFMQVGMFHEMYGVENEHMNIGLVSQMAHDLNIQMTRRKKSIIENSPKNYLMAGFPSIQLDRYINILVEEDWTVIVVDQITDPTSFTGYDISTMVVDTEDDIKDDTKDDNMMDSEDEKKSAIIKRTVSRAITRIASPSTFMEKAMKNDNNFLVSIFIQEDQFKYNKTPGQKLSIVGINGVSLLSLGCSAIDLTTGENYVYETYSNIEDQGLAIDEAFRFLCTFQPREIIVNSDNLKKYDEEGLISKLELHSVPHQVRINNIPSEYKKISYQNTLLKKCFPDHGVLSPLEYLDLESKNMASLSYVLMLQYAYEHNEKLITGLPRPKVLDTYGPALTRPRNLILSNNTIIQLNLIPEQGSHANSNNNQNSKIYRSVLTVLNKTSTAMGSRLLRHRLLNPITDPIQLEEHYSQTEELRTIVTETDKAEKIDKIDKVDKSDKSDKSESKGTQVAAWKEVEKYLRIKDVERMNRKINLKTIQPMEWIELDQDLIKVENLITGLKNMGVLRKFMEEKEQMAVVKDMSQMMYHYRNIIELNQAAKYTLAAVEDNFFRSGYNSELDGLSYKIKHYEQFFKIFTRSLSNLVTPGSDFVTLKRGDSGYTVNITKTRFAQLKLKFIAPITFTIDDKSYSVCLADLMESPVSKNSSNLNVQNATLTRMSLELKVLHEELREKVVEKYYAFLADINKKFGGVLEKVSRFIARIDVMKSIAKVADLYNYCRPVIDTSTTNSFIDATNVRHPIIERINESIKYTPHSFSLGQVPETNKRVQDGMLVYGLNSSGKSSFMKACGINLILAQAGFYVAASQFRYYPYNQLFTRIISNDNLFKSLSSFEMEITELRGIMNRAKDSHSLILCDELAVSTETVSAVAIVAAAIIKFASHRCSFIFTSHLHQLTSMPRITELENVQFFSLKVYYDQMLDALVYDRNLVEGPSQTLYGLEVIRAMHMDPDFIKLADDIRRENMEISPNIIQPKQSKYNPNLYMTQCQVCAGPAEDTHHIGFQCTADNKGFIEHFHKNVLANLVVLCKNCHKAVHAPEKFLKINGYLETSNGIVLDYSWNEKTTKINDDAKTNITTATTDRAAPAVTSKITKKIPLLKPLLLKQRTVNC